MPPPSSGTVLGGGLIRYVGFTESYQSPLPPAAELREIEQLEFGATGRLLSMLERQHDLGEQEQAHRHRLDDRDMALREKGQSIAMWLLPLMLLVPLVALLTDHEAAAVAFAVPIVGVAVVFVLRRLPR